MLLVKVLEKKAVIRLFGLAMILAPFVNTLAKMALLTEVPNRWSLEIFWKIILIGSFFNQVLYVATLVIGAVMLQGKASGWKFALVLLGGYIALQISDFGHVRTSSVTWFFFITNVLAFLFIADQLVWKIEVPQKNMKAPRAPALLRKKILFQFEGKVPWAQLVGVSQKGIRLRRLAEPPVDIATREIEIPLGNGLTLRTRFVRRAEHDYYFDYSNLTAEELKSLNLWLRSLSDAA